MTWDAALVAGGIVFLVAALSVFDLHRQETGSITVYTTPALRDLLEKGIFPQWREEGGMRIEPVYVAAGQQYNRLRMSGTRPEADLFLHASPLFISKGTDEGYFLPINSTGRDAIIPAFRQNQSQDSVSWIAFAWSPLVEVYATRIENAPDLANASLRYGLAHPTLSNNGIYTVLFFEKLDPDVGRHARGRTVVQPVNARANIMGIADGSFDITLGYEAVAKFFQAQGARIKWEVPLLAGERVTTPVLFCAGLVEGPHTDEAREFIEFLYTNRSQEAVKKYHFRSVFDPPQGNGGPGTARLIHFDWNDWRQIEGLLPGYEVIKPEE